MEENKDKKAIQELKEFIEKINFSQKNAIFEREKVFIETLEKIKNSENEKASNN